MADSFYRDPMKWFLVMESKGQRLTREQFRKRATMVGVLFVFAALLLVSRTAVLKNGYEIVELRQERDRLLAIKNKDERRLVEMQSYGWADKVARTQLGMVDVDPGQVVNLEDGASGPLVKRTWSALFGD
ncbi:MAG: hypothetical protein V4498_09835 [candidate division FCPU426 bacterium]